MRTLSRIFILAFMAVLLVQTQVQAKSFHEQPPMTNAEVEQFIKDFPGFKQWMYDSKLNAQAARPVVDKDGNPSFVWDDTVAKWFEGKSWTPERFFYTMTHCSAAIALVLHGDKLTGANRPPDMPYINDYEMNLVRQYQEPLMDALSAKVKKTN
ncbi:hypothetical protein LN040_04120 [Desulfovibrio subterraneus]|uniref:hypothetical protein n=1 Tax=Desulfovibrio subterraneus TaxID=2718620 RepID=UPI0022B91A01|nr:hypothetical protein [Desulfovibrio subterraneus]WBF68297.1 hypothetical protein LN040_04120 [Desulfovibrio subterraneus]